MTVVNPTRLQDAMAIFITALFAFLCVWLEMTPQRTCFYPSAPSIIFSSHPSPRQTHEFERLHQCYMKLHGHYKGWVEATDLSIDVQSKYAHPVVRGNLHEHWFQEILRQGMEMTPYLDETTEQRLYNMAYISLHSLDPTLREQYQRQLELYKKHVLTLVRGTVTFVRLHWSMCYHYQHGTLKDIPPKEGLALHFLSTHDNTTRHSIHARVWDSFRAEQVIPHPNAEAWWRECEGKVYRMKE